MSAKISWFTGEYSTRQRLANDAKVDAYIEFHFNGDGPMSGGTEVLVTRSAGTVTRKLARDLARAISSTWGTRERGDHGVVILSPANRGWGNIARTRMPAVLLEPAFATSEVESQIIKSTSRLRQLATELAKVLAAEFPDGHFGFSIGHVGKPSHPSDRGVAVLGGGWEADYATILARFVAEALTDGTVEMGLSDKGNITITGTGVTQVADDGAEMALRTKMARLIFDVEAQRDKDGNLAVYYPPKEDRGGGYEVAGVTIGDHPREAKIARDLIMAKNYAGAEAYVLEVIAAYTDCVRRFFPDGHPSDHYPVMEYLLRDCCWHRGPTGSAKILQRVLNVTVDGDFGPKSKAAFTTWLEAGRLIRWPTAMAWGREVYERTVMGRNEASELWEGLRARWYDLVPRNAAGLIDNDDLV